MTASCGFVLCGDISSVPCLCHAGVSRVPIDASEAVAHGPAQDVLTTVRLPLLSNQASLCTPVVIETGPNRYTFQQRLRALSVGECVPQLLPFSFSAAELGAQHGRVLATSGIERFVVEVPNVPGSASVESSLPFDLSSSSEAKSSGTSPFYCMPVLTCWTPSPTLCAAGKAVLNQLSEDLKRVASSERKPVFRLAFLPSTDLQDVLAVASSGDLTPLSNWLSVAEAGLFTLEAFLSSFIDEGSSAISAAVTALLRYVSAADEGILKLERVAGLWHNASFQRLVSMLLSRSFAVDLQRYNTEIDPTAAASIHAVVSSTLFRSIQVSQARVCLSSCRSMTAKLHDL